ncbi:MAG: Stp1/IreP family PP2C-type Ser/Thr phosphatase [Rhodocyclaceae bacterium]
MDLSQALEMVTCSDVGKTRSHNEDAVVTNPARGLAILADGMGGYNAGEVASSMAVSLLGESLAQGVAELEVPNREAESGDVHAVIAAAIGQSNAAIYEAAQGHSQCAGMGTTLVVALFRDNTLSVAHIGDSRLYRFRDRRLAQLTRDHSLLQEQIDIGLITPAEARFSQNRNLVTRALGVDPAVEADIADFDTLPGDVYLLCSDGLNDMLDDGEIELTLADFASDLSLAASQLIQKANERGGRDNVSVVLVRVRREFPHSANWLDRVMSWLT